MAEGGYEDNETHDFHPDEIEGYSDAEPRENLDNYREEYDRLTNEPSLRDMTREERVEYDDYLEK